MTKWLRLGWTFLIAGSCVRVSSQEVLFDQPAGSVTNYFIWASSYGSNTPTSSFNYRSHDNFVASGDSRVTTVRWIGTIHDIMNRANNPPKLPGTESWRIAFYEDEDGLPGSLLLEERVPNATLLNTLVTKSVFSGYPIEIREWTAQLHFPLRLRASHRYWISILFLTGNPTPQFSWFYSSQSGDGYYQYSYRDRSLSVGKSDLAFTLEGTVDTGSGNPPPRLSVFLADDNFTLQWTDPDRFFNLESSSDVRSGAVWSVVPSDPARPDGKRVVVIPRSTNRKREFFRLVAAP